MTSELEMLEEETRETKKPQKDMKEILVVQDQGTFVHETGDTYDGFFEAKKKDKSIKMHGLGTYTTAEGDVYTGIWDSNNLSATDDVIIEYHDGGTYEGHVKDFIYNGKAKYTYPDESVLEGNFVDNCPVGRVLLRDINGHEWQGKAHNGYVWFEARNHYYDMLETAPHPKSKRKMKQIDDSNPAIRKGSLTQKEVKINE